MESIKRDSIVNVVHQKNGELLDYGTETFSVHDGQTADVMDESVKCVHERTPPFDSYEVSVVRSVQSVANEQNSIQTEANSKENKAVKSSIETACSADTTLRFQTPEALPKIEGSAFTQWLSPKKNSDSDIICNAQTRLTSIAADSQGTTSVTEAAVLEKEKNLHSPGGNSIRKTTPRRKNEEFVHRVGESDSRRKFRVLGLTFPGKWMSTEKFLDILYKSETFHMWFDKTAEDGTKTGGVSIVFGSNEEAVTAFTCLHKMTVDGSALKLQASKIFYESAPDLISARSSHVAIPFKVNLSEAETSRCLFALHLTMSTDITLLSSILGSDAIESVQLENDPIILTEKQAQIMFRSEEAAKDALSELADGFEIDEGDRQVTMRLLTMEDYLVYMRSDTIKKLPHVAGSVSSSSKVPLSSPVPSLDAPPSSSTALDVSTYQFVPAPDINEEDVTDFVQQHVDETKTNWAELNDVSELWKLLDEVSRLHSGLPDSLLKIGLLNVLERQQRTPTTHWMRQHVDELITKWKKEIMAAKKGQRSTSVILSAAHYIPCTPAKKGRKRSRAHSTITGVSEVLAHVRTKLVTEEGELEVDEDEQGNYTIDGQPLTFESWAAINKSSDSVASYSHSQECNIEQMTPSNVHYADVNPKLVEEKLDHKNEPEVPTISEKAVSSDAVDSTAKKPAEKKELEEGEMSSDSSSSSSASSSSNEGGDSSSRHRHRNRRAHKKKPLIDTIESALGAVNPRFTTIFTYLYEQRRTLAKMLSQPHKHSFAAILRQVSSSPQGMTSAQQNQMDLFIRNLSQQNLPK